MPPDPFSEYLQRIRRKLDTGDATEHTHRPAFAGLIEALGEQVQAVNEPKRRTECGAPDMRVRKGELTLGYVECKNVGASLDEAEATEQVQRYRKHLSNLERLTKPQYHVTLSASEGSWYGRTKPRFFASLRITP